MLVSVVVPLSRGRFGTRLRNCLMAVRRCQPPPTAEIILSLLYAQGEDPEADRGNLKAVIEQTQARLVVHENPNEQWCPGLARNVGFRHATGSVPPLTPTRSSTPGRCSSRCLTGSRAGLCEPPPS